MTAPEESYQKIRRDREKYLAFWRPRIGADAAETNWRAWRLRVFAARPQLVWFAALVVGSWKRWPVLYGFGIALAAFSVVCFALSCVARHRMYRLASGFLGHDVTWRDGLRGVLDHLPDRGGQASDDMNQRGQ